MYSVEEGVAVGAALVLMPAVAGLFIAAPSVTEAVPVLPSATEGPVAFCPEDLLDGTRPSLA